MDVTQLVSLPNGDQEVMSLTPTFHNGIYMSMLWHYPPSKAASQDLQLVYVGTVDEKLEGLLENFINVYPVPT